MACLPQEVQKQIEALDRKRDRLQDEVSSLQAACNEHVQMNKQLSHRISVSPPSPQIIPSLCLAAIK